MLNSIFMLSKYLKKTVTTALILGLMISPILPAAQSISSSISIASQAAEIEDQAEEIQTQEAQTEEAQAAEVEVQAEETQADEDQYDEDQANIDNWSSHCDTSWYDTDPDASEYTIATAEELAGLAKLVNNGTCNFAGKTISLDAESIDLEAYQWVSIGNFWYQFQGNFDGKGCTIKNMRINIEEDNSRKYNYTGFFGSIEGATITDINISSGSYIYAPGKSIGGICGYSSNSKIDKCSNSSNISAVNSSLSTIGGICGAADDSTIMNCINTGMVNNNSLVSALTGGVCGLSCNSKIVNCSNDGNTKDYKIYYANKLSNTGGICGYASNNTEITNCSNSGTVSASNSKNSKVGGICGGINSSEEEREDHSKISNSYYEEDKVKKGNRKTKKGIGNQEEQTGTIGLKEDQMKSEATGEEYTLIDNLNNWIDEQNEAGQDLEISKWEINSEYNSGYPFPQNDNTMNEEENYTLDETLTASTELTLDQSIDG